jgi:peptide/nickel transport system permease protein
VSLRLAAFALLALAFCAAFAPFLANEMPLVVVDDAGWRAPGLAALGVDDFLWFAGFLAACAMLVRGRPRVVLLAIAALVAVYGAAVHRQRTDFAAIGSTAGIHAPVRFGWRNTDFDARYLDPGAAGHPLGTDELGRDVFARLLYGLRLSLLVGFGATAIAMAVGIALGAWAGSGGRIAGAVASWVIQTSFCLPAVFVVAAWQSFGGVSLGAVIIVLALLRFGLVARLTRQECLRVRSQGFVLGAVGLGLPPSRVFLRHVLPNALIPATVAAAFGVAGAILAEAGLSFLGLGVQEPAPSLGRMLNEGRRAAPLAPHLVFLPGLAILVLILACHRIGSLLRDTVDPRGAEATL